MTDLSQPSFFSVHIARARRFHLSAKAPSGRRLRVICGGCEGCAADYEIHRTRFPYLAIEFVSGGRGELTLRGRKSRLVAGTLFSYGPGVPHDIVTDPDKRLVKYFVDFSGSAALKMLRDASLAPGNAVQTSAPSEIMSLLEDLITSGLKNSRYSPPICAALLEAILLKVAESRVPIGSVESKALETYQDCLRRIEERALAIRTIAEISQECGVNQAYLCRLFRRFGHETPYQLLLRLKMNHAATRLLVPGILVKQVAAEMGFLDPYHFSRAFKSVFGMSPALFAQQRHSGADTTPFERLRRSNTAANQGMGRNGGTSN